MAGISDSNHPDDIKLHLERIIEADDAHSAAPDGETEMQAMLRTSVKLPPALRTRIESSLHDLSGQAPGLSAAETTKLLTTRAGRDALNRGEDALGRVDDHLQAVTGERRPLIANRYGVYGDNPVSFGGVLRSLELSATENARIDALPAGSDERKLLFTPLIRYRVEHARDQLSALLGTRLDTRASLSQAVATKNETLDEAQAVISAVRSHLYANLPERKNDPDLRLYGFRPLALSGAAASAVAAPVPAHPDTPATS